jgi:hypothetical protein
MAEGKHLRHRLFNPGLHSGQLTAGSSTYRQKTSISIDFLAAVYQLEGRNFPAFSWCR